MQPLSDEQYQAGFEILAQGGQSAIYTGFIIPQLSHLLAPLFNSRNHISVLEIGPGPKSVLGYLPANLRQKIKRYDAFEPNGLFATRLRKWLSSSLSTESPLPSLEAQSHILQTQFDVIEDTGSHTTASKSNYEKKYDVILFFHSMYGMNPKVEFIKKALEMLTEQPQGAMVVVFHHDLDMSLGDLVCHRTASFPGIARIENNDNALDSFSKFIAGFVIKDEDVEVEETNRIEWRGVCRRLGYEEESYPNHLVFNSPDRMVVFTRHATTLPELTARVPLTKEDKMVKNSQARLQRPAAVVRPTVIRHVQDCVQWALNHGVGLTVMGGGHSGHCILSNVVSIDMEAFDQVHICPARKNGEDSRFLVVAEAGCKTGVVIQKTMAVGLTVPLGARPSVGAGLWLQGGIGHLARSHGLACDAIVGAVLVSVKSCEIICVGQVPEMHQPAGAVRPENEDEILWGIKGAGTNFGIVTSVTFKASVAPTFLTQNWTLPLHSRLTMRLALSGIHKLMVPEMTLACSVDAYLYSDATTLRLGATIFESSTTGLTYETRTRIPYLTVMGREEGHEVVDGVGLFDKELYVSGMHGGHGGGKTSSFKRCLFLDDIGVNLADPLAQAMERRPSSLCYIHFLQGGGAIGDTEAKASAFGCRNWDFACIVTGVWPRDRDNTEASRSAVEWVYSVVQNLLPLSVGAYGADLGPDPRDAALAAKAFGPNLPRLARLKNTMDPHNVLAYACPVPTSSMKPKLIFLVTGESGVGKDHCAEIWASVFTGSTNNSLKVRVSSISYRTKQVYAKATHADLIRLLEDRGYKEEHRPSLTAFFEEELKQHPNLLQESFLDVVYDAADADVLFITGLRDEVPVAALSHLVPDSRLIEVRVQADERTRLIRRGCASNDEAGDSDNRKMHQGPSGYRPGLTFNNTTTGDEMIKEFAENNLLRFVHGDLERLSSMVRTVPDFPRPGIEFRHVLDISQQPEGLALCTSLLQSHFSGDWAKAHAIVCCEAGGFVFASALAPQVNLRLLLIREAGKLPPPVVSVTKPRSYISSSASDDMKEQRIEMEQGVIPKGSSVVVVDDVLSTGETLCAILQLLTRDGISAEDISVIVVAEFPAHRSRELLRQCGFGTVNIQSLLVFGGA